MEAFDYDYHAFEAEHSVDPVRRRIHRSIVLLMHSPHSPETVAEAHAQQARLHDMDGNRQLAAESRAKAARALEALSASRWPSTSVPDEDVPETYRDACGRLRRKIEELVGHSSCVRLYLATQPRLIDDQRRQLLEIYDLCCAGVHTSRDGVTSVFEVDDASDYVRGVSEKLAVAKADWRTSAQLKRMAPVPSAFADTIRMRSCRAKVQTATLPSQKGW